MGLEAATKAFRGAEEQSGLWAYSLTTVQEEWGGGGVEWSGCASAHVDLTAADSSETILLRDEDKYQTDLCETLLLG